MQRQSTKSTIVKTTAIFDFFIKNTLRTLFSEGLSIGKPTPASHRNCVDCCRPVSRLGRPYGRSAFPKGGIISSLPHGSGGCGRLALLFPIIFVARHKAPYNDDILAHSVKKSSVFAYMLSAHDACARLCGQACKKARQQSNNRLEHGFQ